MKSRENKVTEFDKEELYLKEIARKVTELKALCNSNNIPMFFGACVQNNKKDSKYVYEIISPRQCSVKLKEDNITKMLKVINGFEVSLPSKVEEIEYN